MTMQVTDVQKALKGADYPASPQQLAQLAEKNGAGEDLVSTIRGMTKQRIEGPNDVMHELRDALGSTG